MLHYRSLRALGALALLALAACAAPTQPAASPAPSPSATASASAQPSAAPSPVASAAPSDAAAASDVPIPSLPAAVASVQYGGVQFEYDPALVGTAAGATIPPMDYFADRLPAFTEFKFSNPGYTGNLTGWLRVFKVADLAALPENYAQTIAQREPMPPLHAGRVLEVHTQDQTFASGSGSRAVVIYAQNLSAFANDELFYSFQGLTADGQSYVSVAVPVAAPLLPPSMQAVLSGAYPAIPYDPVNPDALTAALIAFNGQVTPQLDALDGAAFSPPLADLDRMVSSIVVQAP